MPIQYRTGDATRPEGDGPKIIAHICNDVGAWGKGFVLALSKRWNTPRSNIAPGMPVNSRRRFSSVRCSLCR